MTFVFLGLEIIVLLLILKWLLNQKSGEKYSRRAVFKFLLLGFAAVIVLLAVMMGFSVDRERFLGGNPIVSGLFSALILGGLAEELMKYAAFRFAVRDKEVLTWLDSVIAAVVVGIGFALLEDIEYALGGGANFLRALLPAHVLFQAVMGYYYGKARVENNSLYEVLSFAVPVLLHTLVDWFLISMMSIIQGVDLTNITSESVANLPYFNYAIPLIICAAAVMIFTFIALIVTFRKIHQWSANNEKQESVK